MFVSKKKFLPFVLILFQTAFSLSAQIDPKLPESKRFIDKVEIYGALTLNLPDDHGWSDYIYEGSEGRTIDNFHAERGYFYGLGLIHSLSKRFELQGRFASERRKYSESLKTLDFNGDVYAESQSQQQNDYVTFSIVPTYFTSRAKKVHLFSGFSYAYLTKSLQVGSNYVQGKYIGSASINTIDGSERHLVDVLLGAGYVFDVNKNIAVVARAQANCGVSYTANQNEQQISVNSLSFTLAIQYSR
jgi:hypothetical protein